MGCFTSRGDTGGSPKRPGSVASFVAQLGCEPALRINVRLFVTELGSREATRRCRVLVTPGVHTFYAEKLL